MKDLRQVDNYAKYMKLLGWEVEKVFSVYIYAKKIPLYGSVIKVQRPHEYIPIRAIINLTKESKGRVAYIEPLDNTHAGYFKSQYFKEIKSPSLPSKTIQFNLLNTQEKLLSAMHQKTRYNIGLAKRKGVIVKTSKDFGEFANFWQKDARSRGQYLSQKKDIKMLYKAFAKDSDLLFACKKNELVGAVLIIHTENISYYMYAASSNLGKGLHAPTLLVWEALVRSKKRGSNLFDFEGIYDERFPLKNWKGFTRFKKSFGGEIVEYPPPLKRIFLPFGL
jgi:lipid II:glycine glycyltransferase (peptidoglycan interpeptide bridge formation enzyme)